MSDIGQMVAIYVGWLLMLALVVVLLLIGAAFGIGYWWAS